MDTKISDAVATFYFKAQRKCYMEIKQPICDGYESQKHGNFLISRCYVYNSDRTSAIEPRLLDNNL